MMTADDVIHAYVRDVAACLPRNKRDDVAFELRALLADDLAQRAAETGQAPDRAMAMDLVREFGRPAEAARRYHERPSLIDPADTHHFVIWALGGTAALAILAALDRDAAFEGAAVLQWLGVLVIVFAVSGWWRRRNPQAMGWKPKADPDIANRGLSALCMAATVIFPVFMYAAPETFLNLGSMGRFSGEGVALTDVFQSSALRLSTLALLIASAAIYGVAAVTGRWDRWLRLTSLGVNAALGVLFAAHAAVTIFVIDEANRIAQPFFGLIAALYLLTLLYDVYREWARTSPAPRAGRAGFARSPLNHQT